MARWVTVKTTWSYWPFIVVIPLNYKSQAVSLSYAAQVACTKQTFSVLYDVWGSHRPADVDVGVVGVRWMDIRGWRWRQCVPPKRFYPQGMTRQYSTYVFVLIRFVRHVFCFGKLLSVHAWPYMVLATDTTSLLTAAAMLKYLPY
jgi:hypothetical protein